MDRVHTFTDNKLHVKVHQSRNNNHEIIHQCIRNMIISRLENSTNVKCRNSDKLRIITSFFPCGLLRSI